MGENSNCTYLVWAYEPLKRKKVYKYNYLNKCKEYTTKSTYTMMLLIGIWINLTKNPINPIIQKPMAVAMAIFWNSKNHHTISYSWYSFVNRLY